MRSQRWIVLIAVVVALLAGVAIAGIPHSQGDLKLKPLPTTTLTTTTTEPGSVVGLTTTTVP